MRFYKVDGPNYDNIVLRRIVKRTENSYQTYQVYRKGLTVVDNASITWTVDNDGNGIKISDCFTEVHNAIIIPETFCGHPVTGIDVNAFKDVPASRILYVSTGTTHILNESLEEISATTEFDILKAKDDKLILRR